MQNYDHQQRRDSSAERLLNFFVDNVKLTSDSNPKKMKSQRDPMMHRMIEKRRRDRMNNCLAELSQLIPPGYVKQGQGRIEKTEIIELAIQFINDLKVGNVNADLNITMQGFKRCMDETLWFMRSKPGYHNALIPQLTQHLDACMDSLRMQRTPCDTAAPKPKTPHGNRSSSGLSTDSGMTDQPSSDTAVAMHHLCSSPPDSTYSMHRFMTSATHPAPLVGMEDMKWSIRKQQRMGGSSEPSNKESSGSNGEGTMEGMAVQEEDSDYKCSPQSASSSSKMESEYEHVVNIVDSTMTVMGHGGYKFKNESHPCEVNDSDNSMNSSYKFKNDITLRFCNAMKSNLQQPGSSDTSSTDSREDEKASQTCSTSSHYPQSEYSSNGGNTSNGTTSTCSSNSRSPSSKEDTSECSSGKSSGGSEKSTHTQTDFTPPPSPTPGFALHPSGVYYIPVTIDGIPKNCTAITEVEKDEKRCHPVSILVNLREPVCSKYSEGPTSKTHGCSGSSTQTTPQRRHTGSTLHLHADRRHHKRKEKVMPH